MRSFEKLVACDGERLSVPEHGPTRAAYFLGEEGVESLSERQALAFVGLLESARTLMRELEGELEVEHGLSFSALGLLGRLAMAPARKLRLTAIAQDMGLSLSRVSRIVDSLERRGLVERRRCPVDARAVEAELTAPGVSLARAAQATHRAGVQRLFYDRLQEQQVATLAEVFTSLLGGEPPVCDGAVATSAASYR